MELVLSGDPITSDGVISEHGSRPRLVSATEDGALVGVVLARQSAEGPTIPPYRVVHAEIEPWGEWPSSLGKEYQVCAPCEETFAVAPATPVGQPGLAALFHMSNGELPSPMFLASSVKAQADYTPYPPSVQWAPSWQSWSIALARGSAGYLAAYQPQPGLVPGPGPGPATHMSLALVDTSTSWATIFDSFACADAPFTADAIPVQGGYLVATAAGRAFGACLLDDDIPGPADEIQVIWVEEVTGARGLSATFEEPDPIAHIALARRAEGAWLVWQNNGASALQPPPVQAVRLDESGGVAGPVFHVTSDGETTGPVAAAALGASLAVAWVDSADPSFPTIRLDLFDEGGALVTGTSINTGPSWLYAPSLSLLASPDGTSLLLAWSDIDGSGAEAAAVRVARFSCASGL